MTRHLRLAAALLLTAALALGCSSTSGPNLPDNGEPEEPQYPLRTSPANVLEKLDMAYEGMDAEAYLDCLAEAFIFYTAESDQNDPENPLPEDWDKATERVVHENMFGDLSDIDRVTLTLTNQDIEHDQGADPGNPADDRYAHVEAVDLRIYIPIPGDDLIFLATANNMFVLAVDPDEMGPAGETLWEIIEWHDLDERVEDSTWGSIKGLYL